MTVSTSTEIITGVSDSEIRSLLLKGAASWFEWDLNHQPVGWQVDILSLDHKPCYYVLFMDNVIILIQCYTPYPEYIIISKKWH